MRSYLAVVAVALIGMLFTELPPTSTSAATTDVLTFGSLGGTNVPVNDRLSASGPASICTSTQGTSCVKCSTTASATVDTNPPAPGTATFTVTSVSVSSSTCTSSISGITGVNGISVNLPLTGSVDDSTFIVTINGPIRVTITFTTSVGPVSCTYQAGSMTGTFSNATNAVTFTNQQFNKTSGPGICPSSVFFSATLRVTDQTQSGNPPIFVN